MARCHSARTVESVIRLHTDGAESEWMMGNSVAAEHTAAAGADTDEAWVGSCWTTARRRTQTPGSGTLFRRERASSARPRVYARQHPRLCSRRCSIGRQRCLYCSDLSDRTANHGATWRAPRTDEQLRHRRPCGLPKGLRDTRWLRR